METRNTFLVSSVNPPSQTPAETPASNQDPVGSRILQEAERQLFKKGPRAFTMDDLAEDLGMSKKTLYVHFPGKEAIIGAIIEGVSRLMRARVEGILNDPSLSTPEKMLRVLDNIGSALSRLTPVILADFKRNSPALFEKIEGIRSRNVPIVFGRLLQMGIADGTIRPEVDPVFACEFWLHAIRGLMDPDTLERTQLTPRQTLEKAVNLFFRGLLTPAGKEQFAAVYQVKKDKQIV